MEFRARILYALNPKGYHLYPFIVPLYSIMRVLGNNPRFSTLFEALYPLFYFTLLTYILLFLANIILNDKSKSSLIVFVFNLFNLNYGFLLHKATPFLKLIGRRHTALMSLMLLTIVLLIAILSRIKNKNMLEFTGGMLSVILLGLLIHNSYPYLYTHIIANLDRKPVQEYYFQKPKKVAVDPDSRPNIYHLVLDSYGRNDVLKVLYNYDNSSFLSELEKRGFRIIPKAKSNYGFTLLSLTSCFNLSYLDNLAQDFKDEPGNVVPLVDLFHHSYLRTFLRENGYTFVAFDSGWYWTDIRDAEVYLTPECRLFKSSYFSGAAFEGTIFSNAIGALNLPHNIKLAYPTTKNSIHKRTQYLFNNLDRATNIAGPKFVFGYSWPPHFPYIYGQNGLNDFDVSKHKKIKYLNELSYINKKLLLAVDRLIKKDPNSLIILSSDHGPLESGNKELSRIERYAIFLAIRFPDDREVYLPENLSLLNLYRLILNSHFNTSYEYLPDKHFLPTGGLKASYYEYFDITSEILKQEELLIGKHNEKKNN